MECCWNGGVGVCGQVSFSVSSLSVFNFRPPSCRSSVDVQFPGNGEEIACVRVRSPLAIVRPPPLTVIQLKLKAPSTGTGQRASLFLTLSPSDYAPHSGRAFNLVRELRYVLGDGRVGMICKSVCSAGIHTRSFGSSRQLVSIGVAWGDGLVLVPSFVEWRAYPFHVA